MTETKTINLADFVGKEVIVVLRDGEQKEGRIDKAEDSSDYPFIFSSSKVTDPCGVELAGWLATYTSKGTYYVEFEDFRDIVDIREKKKKTPKVNTQKIDLKEWVGKSVRIVVREGSSFTGEITTNPDSLYPFMIIYSGSRLGEISTFTPSGKYYATHDSDRDIVAISPEPAKLEGEQGVGPSLQEACPGLRANLDIEKLAALEHEQWAHWTRYLITHFDKDNVWRWLQQCATPYEELSEKEKESDREWAKKVIDLLNNV
jgi:small nuclear ribonucleoprotein (snRNP)-like protein